MIMAENQKTQMIIITGDRKEARFEIVIPPFRPISMFELEDEFDAVCEEIEETIYDDDLSEAILKFVSAFHEAIKVQDIVPLVDYFVSNNVQGMEAQDMKLVFDSLREFIHYSQDENRLMH